MAGNWTRNQKSQVQCPNHNNNEPPMYHMDAATVYNSEEFRIFEVAFLQNNQCSQIYI